MGQYFSRKPGVGRVELAGSGGTRQQPGAEMVEDLVQCLAGGLTGFVDQVLGEDGVRGQLSETTVN